MPLVVEASRFLEPSRLLLRLEDPEVVEEMMEKSLSLSSMLPEMEPEDDLNSPDLFILRLSKRILPEVVRLLTVSTVAPLYLVLPEPDSVERFLQVKVSSLMLPEVVDALISSEDLTFSL